VAVAVDNYMQVIRLVMLVAHKVEISNQLMVQSVFGRQKVMAVAVVVQTKQLGERLFLKVAVAVAQTMRVAHCQTVVLLVVQVFMAVVVVARWEQLQAAMVEQAVLLVLVVLVVLIQQMEQRGLNPQVAVVAQEAPQHRQAQVVLVV
jgi:hypothetical protein